MRYLIAFMSIILTNILFPQEPHPLEFFPHHEGDIFEYETNNSYFQNIITKDSLGEDGKYYLHDTYYGQWVLDTINFSVFNYEVLRFKLDADSGDTWIASNNATVLLRAEVIDVFPSQIFNEHTIIKYIEYYSYDHPDTIFGLYVRAFYLSSKFGILAEFGDPPGQPIYYLRGAKIDGITYGTVTSIDDNIVMKPNDFTLFQNYPNPFNPSTNIEYTLPNSNHVTLKIYNTLGEEVTTLVNEYQPRGSYKVNFNANAMAVILPSGVYIYRLTTDEISLCKKMILIQ